MKKINNINAFKHMISLSLFVCLLIDLQIGNFREVSAQERIPLVVSPARQQLNVDPGSSHNLSIKLINESTVPLNGVLEVVDFIVTEGDGTPTLLDNMSYPVSGEYSASTWINLPFKQLTVPANDVVNINFKVNVPSSVKPGGRYAAVYFETRGLDQLGSGGSDEISSTSSRIVSLISMRVAGDITESAVISNVSLPSFIQFGPVDVAFDIFNKGDYHISPQGQITLKNTFGNIVDKKILPKNNIFPDSKRGYNEKLGSYWMFGKYSLDIEASYGDFGRTATATKTFWVLPITLILIVILSITILILTIVYVDRKIKSRQRVLERKLEMEIDQLESLKSKFKDKI